MRLTVRIWAKNQARVRRGFEPTLTVGTMGLPRIPALAQWQTALRQWRGSGF